MKFKIHENIKQENNHVQLGYVVIRNAKVQGTPMALAQKFFQLQSSIAAVYNIDGLAEVPRLASARNLYNPNEFDITRYDLESEELVRRVLRKKDAYYVNSAVVAAQYCSMYLLLPVGLYDLDQIDGNITYRLPREEFYININGESMPTKGQAFLSDDYGVFANGIVDTRRTAVTLSTKNLLAVVYGNGKVTRDELADTLKLIGETIICYNDGIVEEQGII
ncbi:B3/4 domain-containing protein [Pelosinus sp. sgz500959]|uniref:B3/B4 domain-containing protein n=1 Tax=Pelosinus sp. sgz500959 TaxID=3242472 RepID=UPI00366B0766